ncbi:MAG: hypothetical protein IRY97_02520 [Thermomicrobiaceae bacterium]|nr:hypothetical protein [Thermomicrobiaceae bacterium]
MSGTTTEAPRAVVGAEDARLSLALALFDATSLSELRDRLAAALEPILPSGTRHRLAVVDDEGRLGAEPLEGTGWQATLPLRHRGEVVGALVVGHAEPDASARGGLDELAALAPVIAAAVAQQRRLAGEYERIRSGAAASKFDLIAVLSHEMRTPLASIKGYASALLLDDVAWDDDTRVEFLQAIDAESDRLTQLITDILDSAVIDAGELHIDREPVLLPPMARRVVGKLAIHTDRHRFVLSFPPDFPVVLADEHRIDQVLTNLIDNAIKYSPDGGLIVVSGEVAAGEVVIRVADQGVGIAPEHLNKLFERFFRARPDGRSAVVGTGLGLPISDAIVRAHGGRIWAESALGRGTTFSFTLPLSAPALAAGEEER